MKKNAVLRIVIWSVVLCLLVGLLLVGLSAGLGWRGYLNSSKRVQNVATTPLETETVTFTGTVTEATYVYRAPSLDSDHVYPVKAGQTLEFLGVEIVAGDEWLLLDDSSQERGWIQSKYVQMEDELPRVDPASSPETTYPHIDVAATAIEAAEIYSGPGPNNQVEGQVNVGDAVNVCVQKTVNGTSWVMIDQPVLGWMEEAYLQYEDVPFEEVPATAPGSDEAIAPLSGTVATATDVHTSPQADSTVLETLEAGAAITVAKRESVAGSDWALITAPVNGWVLLADVELEEPAPTEAPTETPAEATVPEDFVQGGSVDASKVNAIQIEWASGNILLEPADRKDIVFLEEQSNDPMVWRLEGKTLNIQFSEPKLHNFFGVNFTHDKDLIVQVPRDWDCRELELDAASAKLNVRDMTIGEVELDTASGTCTFENCQVDSLDIDTASGDVNFSGTLNTVDYDAASADLTAVLSNTPKRIDIDSASGGLDLTLPEDAGFSLKMDTMSGRFRSDFPTTRQNDWDVCGDGACKINVDAMSGSVHIRKGA